MDDILKNECIEGIDEGMNFYPSKYLPRTPTLIFVASRLLLLQLVTKILKKSVKCFIGNLLASKNK